MPNWCRNEVIVRSTDYANLKRMLNAAEEGKLLEFLRPFTKDTNYEWDYNWCVNNWGTKWDIGEITYAELSPTILDTEVEMFGVENDGVWELRLDFETAWSPATVAFLYAADAMGFEFDLYYMEEGDGYVGCCNYTKAYGMEDYSYDLYYYGKDTLPSEEEYLDHFPYHLVEHFNLSHFYEDLAETAEAERLGIEEMAGVGNG